MNVLFVKKSLFSNIIFVKGYLIRLSRPIADTEKRTMILIQLG